MAPSGAPAPLPAPSHLQAGMQTTVVHSVCLRAPSGTAGRHQILARAHHLPVMKQKNSQDCLEAAMNSCGPHAHLIHSCQQRGQITAVCREAICICVCHSSVSTSATPAGPLRHY